MLREFQQRPDAPATGGDVEATIAKFGAMNRSGCNAQPHEIAAAALFQVSGDASYVNGGILAVDGGTTA